jgi:hypothetical protein
MVTAGMQGHSPAAFLLEAKAQEIFVVWLLTYRINIAL